MNTTDVTKLCRPEDYQSLGRQHLFPSPTSISWFIRLNRDRLVKAGAILKVGNRMVVDPDKFDAVVLLVGRELAEESMSTAGTSVHL